MKKHILEREQILPIGLMEAWEFFSTPNFLERITPEGMGFEIRGRAPDRIQNGTRIAYRVWPLFGIPIGWLTEITDVDPPHAFTDIQLKGPFASWVHQHRFTPTSNGVLIQDRVTYSMPFGMMGGLAHALVVKKRLKAIFDHRAITLEVIHGGSNKKMDRAPNDLTGG